jgi:hypothetical protein
MRVGHEDAVPDDRHDAGNDSVRHGVGTMRAIVIDGYGTAAEIVRAVEPIPGASGVTTRPFEGGIDQQVEEFGHGQRSHTQAIRRPGCRNAWRPARASQAIPG